MHLRPCGAAQLLSAMFGKGGKVLAALMLVWTVVLMGRTAALADTAFPMVDGFPFLGLVMLAVAAWGGEKGAAACGRCAGVLSLFLLALYGLIAVFALPDVQLRWLQPLPDWENGIRSAGWFLMPAAIWFLPCRRGKTKRVRSGLMILPCSAALLAAITDGVLSPQLAAQQSPALYMVAQSVSLFGVLERMEPLLSVAMTMGVFSLLSALTCACRELGREVALFSHWPFACCTLAALTMGYTSRLDDMWLTVGTSVFYVLFPLSAVQAERRKAKRAGI